MRVLLDTCTFLWIVSGASELSETARRTFRETGNEIYLSAASVWEIAVKHALGRLPLPGDPDALIPAWRSAHAIEPLAVDEAAVLQLTRLPRLHRDPFDRMLVCQAIAGGMVILTPDREVAAYPVRTLW
ncbi:MAG: type II toxin-antitoxin system VapC family toxin [Planctomycetes bacterium]|nr:type II toxin-antitoxin system VapC family toxin [Planctomycetota bacterium]